MGGAEAAQLITPRGEEQKGWSRNPQAACADVVYFVTGAPIRQS
jgi:hypothetical protein